MQLFSQKFLPARYKCPNANMVHGFDARNAHGCANNQRHLDLPLRGVSFSESSLQQMIQKAINTIET